MSKTRVVPRQYHVIKCLICDYRFSDLHHVLPSSMGGKKSRRIPLCPNHHRNAHMVYDMINYGRSPGDIKLWCTRNMDVDFTTILLDSLIVEYTDLFNERQEQFSAYIFNAIAHGAILFRRYTRRDERSANYWGEGPWFLASDLGDNVDPVPEETITWMTQQGYLRFANPMQRKNSVLDKTNVFLTDAGRREVDRYR